MTKREWIKFIIEGRTDIPVAQHWGGFFNSQVAKKLTPGFCHYDYMGWYDAPEYFDMSALGPKQLDRMIAFNNYTGRCFACLGKGANINYGHGGPGEFFIRTRERLENGILAEFETGVLVDMRFNPHFYHSRNYPISTLKDLNQLKLPDPADPNRYKGLAEDVRYLKSKGEYVLGSLNGVFSGLHYFFMKYEHMLVALFDNPHLIHALLEQLGQWNLIAAENMINAGIDCITFCDDLGSRDNLIISPDQYRLFIKPWHQKICEKTHAMGAAVHLHCHGAIQLIMGDLVACGFDFINPFDPDEKWDIEQLLAEYNDKFVVVGGIPAKFWDWQARQQEVYLQRMVSLSRKYGRFILLDSGGIPETVTKADFERIIELSRHLRGVENVKGCV
jgi:uroporphyrinogen-III decarboxylase